MYTSHLLIWQTKFFQIQIFVILYKKSMKTLTVSTLPSKGDDSLSQS